MGSSWCKIILKNETPYTWHYSGSHVYDPFPKISYTERKESGTLKAREEKEYWPDRNGKLCMFILKYGDHQHNSFSYPYSGYQHTTFTIRESLDRSVIELHCSTRSVVETCPNYAKKEKDQQRREEEQRRQERQERERRIEEEISKETEEARRSLTEAKLNLSPSLREQEGHRQCTHVLQQVMGDHETVIERDEQREIEQKFEELLLDYQISENESLQDVTFEDRMRNLQTELTVQYFREKHLSLWPLFTLENAIMYEDLSLTERFCILKAVTEVTLAGNPDAVNGHVHQLECAKRYNFHLSLLEHLNGSNSTLAGKLLLAFFDTFSDVSQNSRELLSQILFSNIWTPVEILLFLRGVASMDQKKTDAILHTVQTYRLDLLSTLSALRSNDPNKTLQGYAEEETDKDIDTILSEMRDANYPEKLLSIMETVLGHIEEKLSKDPMVDTQKKLSKREKMEMIKDFKNKIKLLNFAEADNTILKEVLITMCIAVKDCSAVSTQSGEQIKGYFPRLTQLASLLMLLLPKATSDKGCLLEIGTGEGKSCILAMFAAIQAIRGATVDIVTSSPILARRDEEEWRKLFDMFDITSSVVPPPLMKESSLKSCDKILQDAYKRQIVYGTVSDFAADTLRQEFEKNTTRGERKFDLVIVDEVDYMTLDSGVQVTFLSHEASGLRHVEQVLASIWCMISVCRPIRMEETGETEWITGIQHFHKAAKMAVMGSDRSEHFSEFDILQTGLQFGFYTQEDIDTLMQSESEAQRDGKADDFQDENWKAIEAFMTKIGVEQQYDLLSILETALDQTVFIDCYTLTNNKATSIGEKKRDSDMKIKMLLLNNGRASEIMSEKSLIDAVVLEIQSKIIYSDQCQPNSEETDNYIVIPFFLKKYIENRMPVFVGNALKAIAMKQGREYMIGMSSDANPSTVSESDKHFYHAIIPVDYQASGVLEKNKRWSDGLQQFLEMKHQLAISSLSNVTNYMSNIHYFKRYLKGSGIFGVSGTLGGNADKHFLKRHYKSDSYTIPSHRHNKVVELPALQVSGDDLKWIEVVCESALKAANRNQVVLVVCEDVKTANELQVAMANRRANQRHPITMYTISERDNIEQTTFSGGSIIIATNLGGRGTDIRLEQKVNQCGGLFVLLTHFPDNRRVEKQVFGRTARKGNSGMVQMILHCDQLAPAYQGQPVEIMRQLREDHEIQRITGMETNELQEIERKEKLFSTVCQFLDNFDSNYSEKERENLLTMKVEEHSFRRQGDKLDYQPALNALKESWALWLTLHETHIEKDDDISDLEADLLQQLTNTRNMMLKGQSQNFYDHLKQAVVRTNLHCRDKTKWDYDAKSSWQKAAKCDPFYRAVALYNQAYITINLAESDYKTEASNLLQEAKDTLGIYISETTNTLNACQMAMRGNFEPHHDGVCNFQSQMQSRMNIFQAWLGYINSTLKKLAELKNSKSSAITEDSSVYALSDGTDYVTTTELMALYEYGLGMVFEVKEKPRFNIDALVCFLLGACQVLAGVLVCALSYGSASQFGLALISEGVSDMISGCDGMITGSFSWASWAISKSIGIGISLLTAGFGTIKRAVQSVYKATKGLLTGTKTLSSVAKGVIKSGKHAFMSFKGSVTAASSLSLGTVKKLGTKTVVKQTFKHATKYAGQEMAKQIVTHTLHYFIDAGLQAVLKEILNKAFKDSITSVVKENDALSHTLTELVCSGVPKSALQKPAAEFKIDRECEKSIKDLVKSVTEKIISDLMTDCSTVHEIIDRLAQVSSKASDLMDNAGVPGKVQTAISASLCIAKFSTVLVQMLNSIPTEKCINDRFSSKLIKEIHVQLPKGYDQDGRHRLLDVGRLKNELLEGISENVSQEFIESCARHMNSLITQIFKEKINKVTNAIGNTTSNMLGRYKTENYFVEQKQRHDMKSASKHAGESTCEIEQSDLHHYIDNISDIDRPASELDIYVLTKSDLLQGQGIRVKVVDKHGKPLDEQSYPGTDCSAGYITLKLTMEPETAKSEMGLLSHIQDRIQGVQTAYSGHFTIVQPDGCETRVMSEGQNCMYHALIQATSRSQEQDIKEQARILRKKVQSEVQENLPTYCELVKLQKRYDNVMDPGKYSILGGARPEKKIISQDYRDAIAPMAETDYIIAQLYDLGYVATYKDVRNTILSGRYAVEADHIIPKDTLRKALVHRDLEKLKSKNSQLYALVTSIQSDPNGRCHLVMQVLYQHHRTALTTGNCMEAKRCRALLADTLVSGNAEKMLKQAMIMANPVSSQKLRANAGINRSSIGKHQDFSENGTNCYYKAGFMNVFSEYLNIGIIDQNQHTRLKSWAKENRHQDTNTEEFREIQRIVRGQQGEKSKKRVRGNMLGPQTHQSP
ncbi:uncharacterized protein LOC115130877 isoform X1 [Oncorhynchus nerka]|uniref:uncharacterized protein LOC115130877 isoform X1 n=1 Tax=Oncorhynchus nerka TaxID=8023 RepID=UPI0031B82421